MYSHVFIKCFNCSLNLLPYVTFNQLYILQYFITNLLILQPYKPMLSLCPDELIKAIHGDISHATQALDRPEQINFKNEFAVLSSTPEQTIS